MKYLVAISGLSLFLFSSACVKKTPNTTATPPQDTVRRFVELSAGVKEDTDKQKLLELCQGEMRRALERMTPEAFRVAYMSNAVKLKEVKILNTELEAQTAKVSYQVFLDNPQGTDPTQEINQREVELVLVAGSWLIENIKAQGSDQIAFTRGMIF